MWYKRIPYQLRVSSSRNIEGWPGGIPAVVLPDNTPMWDSTSMILHFENREPAFRSVLPDHDKVLLFLNYLIEDISDEWLYRLATGTRWFYMENTVHAGFELSKESSVGGNGKLPADQVHRTIIDFVRSTCGPGGFDATTRDSFVDEVLRPWVSTLSAHFANPTTPYLFGSR